MGFESHILDGSFEIKNLVGFEFESQSLDGSIFSLVCETLPDGD